MLATADDFGKVNLFRYPSIQERAQHIGYSGHSSHVMNVRWTVADECLISCGGNDKCVFQWKHSIVEMGGSGGAAATLTGAGGHSHAGLSHSHGAAAGGGEDDEGLDDGDASLLQGPAGGDESGAVKPWYHIDFSSTRPLFLNFCICRCPCVCVDLCPLCVCVRLGAIKTPKNPPHINPSAPSIAMELKWVHGFTSGTSAANTRVSDNLCYNADKDIVFPAAALGIKLNRPLAEDNASSVLDVFEPRVCTQTYFTGHDDDILSLAISSCRFFF